MRTGAARNKKKGGTIFFIEYPILNYLLRFCHEAVQHNGNTLWQVIDTTALSSVA